MWRLIRHLAESFGILEPVEDARSQSQHVRHEALDVNATARKEIHDSRERRGILQLEYELARARGSKR
jgi:hypothetical protein